MFFFFQRGWLTSHDESSFAISLRFGGGKVLIFLRGLGHNKSVRPFIYPTTEAQIYFQVPTKSQIPPPTARGPPPPQGRR